MDTYSQSIPITLNENSKKLLNALSIKNFSINKRISTFYLIQKFLKQNSIIHNECLKKIEKSSNLYTNLQNKDLLENSSEYIYSIDDNNLLLLVKQIGTQSVNGIIFKVVGNIEHNFEKSIIISCKIIAKKDDHKKEIEILNLLTLQVLNKINIHFPISYFTFFCNSKHGESTHYPELIENNKYYMNLNEIAEGDVSDLLENTLGEKSYNNLIAQIIVAIYSFHKLGYTHNDAHTGNFLYHILSRPNNSFAYNIFSRNYYINNVEFLIVLWDFATAQEYYEPDYHKDYIKIFKSIKDTIIDSKDSKGSKDIEDSKGSKDIEDIEDIVMHQDDEDTTDDEGSSSKNILDDIIDYLQKNTENTEDEFIKYILTLGLFSTQLQHKYKRVNNVIKL